MAEFLRTIHKHKAPGEYIDVSVFEPGYPIKALHKRRFFTDPQEAEAWGLEYSRGKHVFFGVLPHVNATSTKENVADRWGVLWADIDLPQTEAYELIDNVLLHPTIVVSSGKHIQAYWVLSETVSQEEGTLLQRQLSTMVAGDTATSNNNRLMRLPGTQHVKDINNPLPCSILTIDPQYVYTPKDFAAALDTKHCPILVRKQAKYAVKPRKKDGDEKSNSDLDWKVIMHLLRCGMSDEGIKSALLNPRLRVSALLAVKIADSEHYLNKTITKAHAEHGVGKSQARQESFTQREDGIYVGDVKVATFTIEPTMIIRGKEDVLYCTINAQDVTLSDVILPRSAFNSMAALLEQLGSLSCQWIGSEKQVRQLLPYLAERARLMEVPEITGVEQAGVYDDIAVSANQVVHKDMGVIPISAAPIFLLDADKYTSAYTTKWQAFSGELFLRQLHKHLLQLNTPQRIIPMLGWFMGLAYKSQLSKKKRRYPLCMAWGTRGGGKTSLIEIIFQPLMGYMDEGGISSMLTPFAHLQALSRTTSLIPTYFSEYRMSNYNRLKFEAMLRMTYDESKEQRGRSNQTVKEYHLTAPVIITGEDPFTDPALVERTNMIRFSEADIKDNPTYNNALDELRQMRLQEFSLPYLQHCLQTDANELFTRAEAFVNSVPAWKGVPHRMRHTIAVCTMGLMSYSDFVGKHGIVYNIDAADMVEVWAEYLDDFLGSRGRTLLAADEFVRDMVLAVAFHSIRDVGFPHKWDVERGVIWFHLATAYNWWVAQARRRGAMPLEQKAILAQLREIEYCGKPQSQRDGLGKASMQMYPIDLAQASKSIDDLPAALTPPLKRVK